MPTESGGMPTRRDTLLLAGGALASLSGCLSESAPAQSEASPTSIAPGTRSPTRSPAGTPTVAGTDRPTDTDRPEATRTDPPDAPETVTTVTGDLPAWQPVRRLGTGYANVQGLDAGEGRLYATLNDEHAESAVAALEPGADRLAWTTECEGDPEAGSHLESGSQAGTWGVTVADGTVYSVHGRGKTREWTDLHALDAATGRRRWSVRREQRLAVAGFVGDSVVATGREFFEPEYVHDTPEEPLDTTVYALDAATGEQRWARVATDARGATVGPDGVYVAHGDALTALDRNGEQRWARRMADGIRRLTVVDGAVVAVVGTDVDSSTLVGVSPDGTRAWGVEQPTRYLLPAGDRVYAMDDNVVAVTGDGTVAWRQRVHGHDPLLAVDGDRLYTRTAMRMNAVDAFDLPGGDRRFRFETPSDNGWPLAATEETLVAEAITPERAEFTSLFAVDADTGHPRAVYRPSDTVFTARAYDGAAYVGFGDGRIGVFGDA